MDAIMRRLEAIRLRAAEILTELEEHTNLLEQDDLDAETRTARIWLPVPGHRPPKPKFGTPLRKRSTG